jgi:hypothetical protein
LLEKALDNPNGDKSPLITSALPTGFTIEHRVARHPRLTDLDVGLLLLLSGQLRGALAHALSRRQPERVVVQREVGRAQRRTSGVSEHIVTGLAALVPEMTFKSGLGFIQASVVPLTICNQDLFQRIHICGTYIRPVLQLIWLGWSERFNLNIKETVSILDNGHFLIVKT